MTYVATWMPLDSVTTSSDSFSTNSHDYGQCADPNRMNLHEIYLADINLEGANLERTGFTNTSLKEAN